MLESITGCPMAIIVPAEAKPMTIRLYPNPAEDKLSVSLSLQDADRVTVRVVDVVGSTHYNLSDQKIGQGQYQADIDVSRLRAGIYFVKISTTKGAERILKFVKK